MSFCYTALICLKMIITVSSFLNTASFNYKTVGYHSVDKMYFSRVRFHPKSSTWFNSLFFMRAVIGAKEHKTMQSQEQLCWPNATTWVSRARTRIPLLCVIFFRFWKKHPILPGFVLSPRNMQIIQHVSIVYRTTRYFLRLFQHKLSTTRFFPASVDLLPARIKFLHSKALKGKTASMGRFARQYLRILPHLWSLIVIEI